jgi:agmatine deiminase
MANRIDRSASPRSTRATDLRMPAEWERQEATWLTWPDPNQEWLVEYVLVANIFADLIKAIADDQRVDLLVNTDADRMLAKKLIGARGGDLSRVVFHDIPSNDCWTRDTGPTFVVGSTPAGMGLKGVCWRFNAWGGKYEAGLDAQISKRICGRLGVPTLEPGIQFEGGSIDVNGRGVLLTTEQCLLNENRNPGKSKADLETILHEYLGVSKIIWLGEGIAGDDTDGHVDDLTRFVDERTVVTVVEDDPADANYKPLIENYRRLERQTDQDGRSLTVLKLPMPRELSFKGHRVPASYANFLFTNRQVIVPIFDDRNDQGALDVLRKLCPGRKITGIRANELVSGFGAFHCVSQQQPALSGDWNQPGAC